MNRRNAMRTGRGHEVKKETLKDLEPKNPVKGGQKGSLGAGGTSVMK